MAIVMLHAGAKAWLGASAVAVDTTAGVQMPQQAVPSTEGAVLTAVGDGELCASMGFLHCGPTIVHARNPMNQWDSPCDSRVS